MLITIYDSTGTPKAELSPNDSSTQVKEIQGDSVLTLSFTHYDHISLDVDDYVDFEGERFWLNEKYRPRQNARKEWVYDIKLYGVESMLKRLLVIKTVDDEDDPVFTLTAPPYEHVAMIVRCMNNGLGNITDWKVGQVDGSENIVIDYFGKYCDEALKEIAEKVGAEAWVEGQTVNICKCEHGVPIPMGYGKGLLSIDPGTADNVKFYTRLYPVGSSRNIDREKYGYSRLQLPGGQKYVEINADKYGRVDHYEADAFADIYPRRTGVVSNVRSEVKTGEDGNPFTIYYFSDNSLPFDPNAYEIGGLVKRVSFQEGSELAGLGEEDNGTYFFEVNFNSSTREFEIITIWPYDNDMQLPGDKLIPKIGDKYILWNLRMPDEYYELAEAEFMSAVDKYNADHNLDISVYKAPTDHVWIEDNEVVLTIGQRIRLESDEYFPETGYRDSRITKITRKVNLTSSMDIEISDALSRTAQEKMSDSIDDVRSYAKSIGESINLPDLIRSGDNTIPTDNNIFSAKRSRKEFLSKIKSDRTPFKISSDQGFEIGTYDPGVEGGIFGMDENGDSFAEVARLFVRVRAFFEELTIVRSNVLAGKQYITPGGGIKCTKVDETANAYRCYFLSEQDGEKSETKFVVYDLAISETFNAKTGTSNKVSNHRYWRLVTAVNNDAYTDEAWNHYGYIDLSKTICETGSDIPVPGDEICQLGYQGNGNLERQTAIVFSTVDADSPSIKMYSGINSFTLADRAVIRFGRDSQTGKIFFRLGKSNAAHYLEYSQDGGLEVAGRISASSTYKDPQGNEHSIREALEESIIGVDVLYRLHGSSSVAPELPIASTTTGEIIELNGWSTIAPSGQEGMYMWQVTYTQKGDGRVTFSDPTCISGATGASGTPAKVVIVNAESTAFLYSDNFKTLVGPANIKITASLQGTIGYQWSYKLEGSTEWNDLSGTEGHGQSITLLPNGIFGSTAKSITMRCTSGGVSDEATIVKVSSGSNGQDGSSYSPNLLKGTKTTLVSAASGNYAFATYYFDKPLDVQPGDKFAFSVENIEVLEGNPAEFDVYLFNIASNKSYGSRVAVTKANPIATLTVSEVTTAQTIVVYAGKQGYTAGNKIRFDKVMLVKGDTPMAWGPATSEMMGQDAYTVLLSNESHIFEGDTEKAFAASTESAVIAYKGATQVEATIGTITGMPPGMTVAISNNGSISAKFLINVTTDLTTKQGILNVPVTLDGLTFTQVFSWALSLRGKDGRGIISVVEEYALSATTTSPADSEFGQAIPTMTDALPYMWNREKTTYTDGTVDTSNSVMIGVRGANGVDGATIVSVTNYYLASENDSGVTASTQGWTTDASTSAATMTAEKQYLWNYEVTKWSKGADTQTQPHVVGRYGSSFTDNLLLKTNTPISNDEYLIASYNLAEIPKVGETYTFTLWGQLASTKTAFAIYNSNGGVHLGNLNKVSDGIYSLTFKWRKAYGSIVADDSHILVYTYKNDQPGTSSIDGVKLEKGSNATPQWTPNSREMIIPTFTEQYYLSTSNTELIGGTWQDTAPQWSVGHFIWTRTKITYATGEVKYTDPVCATGAPGASGEDVYTLDLTNEVAGVACDATGTPIGTLPSTEIMVYKGASEDTGWSFQKTDNGCTSNFNWPSGFPTLSISAISADTATVTIQANKAGLPTLTATMNIYKVKPGQNGAQGYSVVASVSRPSFTEAQWNLYGTIGHIEGWSNTSDIRNGCRVGDYFRVYGTATDTGKSHVAVYKSDTTSGSLHGECVAHEIADAGADGEDAVVYALELSDSNISRNALGQLSTNALTVWKYKTTGASARELTTEKTVRYQRIGYDASWQILSAATSSYSIPVPASDALKAIVVELLDGTSVLDRERIPVLTDASDLELAGPNLLLNSTFLQGQYHWTFKGSTIAPNINLNGISSVKIDSKNSNTDTYNGINQIVQNPEPGAYYAFSVYAYYVASSPTNGVTDIDKGAYAEIAYYAPDGRHQLAVKAVDLTKTGKWQRLTMIAQCPLNATSFQCMCYIVRNGTVWFACPQLTKGNQLSDFAPSPNDTDYIQSALKESSSIEGGLILASLIRLGYTAEDGEYKTTSGINGIGDNPEAIAVWGGGEMIDRAYSPASNAALFALRHNGTAYFAGNTVRLGENVMQIGDNLQLDDKGLSLNIGSKSALQVGDVEVSDSQTSVSQTITLAGKSFSMGNTAMLYRNLLEDRIYPSGTATYSVNAVKCPAGSILSAAGTISWPKPNIADTDEKFITNVYLDIRINGTLFQSFAYILEKQSQGNTFSTPFNIGSFKIQKEALVEFRLRFSNPLVLIGSLGGMQSTWELVDGSPFAGATLTFTSGSLNYETGNQTTLGNNGLLASWGQSLFMCSGDGVVMRFGNTILRVDANGMRKSTDGGATWTTL